MKWMSRIKNFIQGFDASLYCPPIIPLCFLNASSTEAFAGEQFIRDFAIAAYAARSKSSKLSASAHLPAP